MAPIRIPEGFVLVKPRSVELAKALLAAADEIGADRHLSVRTVGGGYHVAQAVAEKFQDSFPEVDADMEADGVVDETEGNETPDETEDETQVNETQETQVNETQEIEDEIEEETEDAPLPVTADSSVAEIDAYAESVKVDISAAKNRAEKIALLEAARQPKTPNAE